MALYVLTNVFSSTTVVVIIHAYIEYSDSCSFQVLVCILSVVDDTKLVSKVWFYIFGYAVPYLRGCHLLTLFSILADNHS